MKLSKVTREILKNFHAINQSIVFKPGNMLRTASIQTHIIASAQIDEEIPNEFAIYELSELLSTIGIFTDPELTFAGDDEPFTISEGKNVVKYVPSSQSLVSSAWGVEVEDVTDDMIDVSFSLSKDVLEQVFKTSSILKLDDCAITNKGLKVFNKNDPTGNQLVIDIDFYKKRAGDFSFEVKVQNLKVLQMNYTAEIVSGSFIHLVSDNCRVEYFIALDAN